MATLIDRAAVKVCQLPRTREYHWVVIFIASFYLRTTSVSKVDCQHADVPFILFLIGVIV